MNAALLEAAQRVERFKRLGGVDLGALAPKERYDMTAEVHIGLAHLRKTIFRYRCPECGHEVDNDQEMSPACTGPSWLDEHLIRPMQLAGAR